MKLLSLAVLSFLCLTILFEYNTNHAAPFFNFILENWNHVLCSWILDEGVYNTYIIDTDYREWALIMHCAEKEKSSRYLSALMLSRTPRIGVNVISFLRFVFTLYFVDSIAQEKFFLGTNCRSMILMFHLCFQ